MVNRRLTSAQAAERLGIKPATLYAYVSRGVLSRVRTPAGSTFDAQEVARLARSSRHPAGEGASPARSTRLEEAGDPVFVTELTLIDDGRLYYRGLDAVHLSRTRSFEEVAVWLWEGRWAPERIPWKTPAPAGAAVSRALGSIETRTLPVERFVVAAAVAALTDELRHDLSPAAVAIVGRGLLSTLVDALPVVARPSRRARLDGGSISERLWPRLSRLPLDPDRKAVLEAALVLSADHELAPSTLAARVAAAFRADPYSVVATGLGPASGSWRSGSSGAPSEVENLLAEAAGTDAERAIGERLRRTGSSVHGFGMPLYPAGDPRGAELLSRLEGVRGHPDRHALVDRVVALGQARGFPAPNVDLGLGALAFCGDMIAGAGQAIATLGKAAGWLAHAMEEYADPTRFRTRAAYLGPAPPSPQWCDLPPQMGE
jgi:citrate synthase